MKDTVFFKFAKYTLMNAAGMIGLSCYILADTFFVSKGLGADGLAALNLAIPVYSFVNGAGLMTGIGGGTAYSMAISRGDRKSADRIFTISAVTAAIAAALFVMCGIFLPDVITGLMGGDPQGSPQVYEMTLTYLRIILLFSPGFILNNLLVCFRRNDGAPGLAMAAMLAGSFSNIIFDYILIFPCKMGILGAVLATAASPLISMGVLSLKKSSFRLCRSPFGLKDMLSQLSAGVPSLVAEVSAGAVMVVFNTIILGISGNTGVAAYGVVANISLVVISVFTGIAQGMQPVLSSAYGSGRIKETAAVLRYGIITALVLAAGIYSLVVIFASPITAVFNSENIAELQTAAEKGLVIYFTACPFAAVNLVLAMYFSSTKREKAAQAVSLLRGFILVIPLAFVLSELFSLTGVWLALPAAELLTAAAAAAMLKLPGKDRI